MSEYYPLVLLLASVLACFCVLLFTRPRKEPNRKSRNTTKTIDKLINNSNSGISVMQYKDTLSQYDINYVAWKVKRDGPAKQ